MKETTFIEKNQDDWRQLEQLLNSNNKDADSLVHLFEKVSGDLAYARTYYPNRSIRVYLNNLTQSTLNTLVKKREKFKFSSILDFYRKELPAEIYRSRKAFITSFLVFAIAVLIGVISSANVDNFANIILGDRYIEMTDENINNGDPMAVYKGDDSGDMFMFITVNNIRVSFLCFVLGLLGSFGTSYILLYNGIMVGAFQFYFYKKGLFLTSFLTIWIHGTIEISSIIIAGAAGFILGNGLLFPKSYTRNTSLLLAAKRSLRIILAIMPLFVIAGFLESFVTRLTELPMIVKILIIALSALFILLTFVIYPIYCHRNGLLDMEAIEMDPVEIENVESNKYVFQSLTSTMATSLGLLRQSLGQYLYQMVLPAFIFIAASGYFILKYRVMTYAGIPEGFSFTDFKNKLPIYGFVLYFITTIIFVWLILWSQKKVHSWRDLLVGLKKYFLIVSPFAAIFTLGYYYIHNDLFWLYLLVLPIHFFFIMLEEISQDKKITLTLVWKKLKFSYQHWFGFLPISIGLYIYFVLVGLLTHTSLISIFTEFVSWHNIFDNSYADRVFVENIKELLSFVIPLPLLYFAYIYRYGSLTSLTDSVDLQDRLESFGKKDKNYAFGR